MVKRVLHKKRTNLLANWTQTDIDKQIVLGNLPSGTTPANIVLSSNFAEEHDLEGIQAQLVAGTNIDIDNTDPNAPVISATGGGSQTPWTSNIDGGNYDLINVNEIDAALFKGQYSNAAHSAYINPDGSAVFASGAIVINNAGDVTTNITANRAVVTNASKVLTASATTDTQIGYLSTATSDVQTQITARELLVNKATDFTTINNTLYPTVQAVNNAITTAVTGLLDYRGTYNASANLFPATGGSGLVGAILKGDFWICSIAGTLGGVATTPGDLIIAIVDTPGQTAANWDIVAHNLGSYVTSVSGTTNRITSTGGSTPIIDISAAYTGQNTIVTLGTVTTGTWNAGVLAGQYGGTGVANTGKTITLGGSLTTLGAFTTTLTATANTSVTLPTTGTLATLAGSEALTNKTVNGVTLSAAGVATTYLDGTGAYSTPGGGGGGSSAFSALTSGSNTTAAMVVDSGASLAPSGTGTITATSAATASTATTATTATNVTVSNEATDTTCFPLFSNNATAGNQPKSNANLTFNANTGQLGTKSILLPAGTTTLAPINLTSGSLKSTPTNGSIEYDTTNLYCTNDINNGGRAVIPAQQEFGLVGPGSAITTIDNFFGANSNLVLTGPSTYYIVEAYLWYTKTTAGTVTFSLVDNGTPSQLNWTYELCPATGINTTPGVSLLTGQQMNVSASPTTSFTTASLSAGTHYAKYRIWIKTGISNTSLKFQVTSNTGSVTPLGGSIYFSRRISGGQTGTFAA